MSSLSNAKLLGGIGSILVLLTAVPNVGWLFGIAGLVMILLAIRDISRVVGEKNIFSNMRNAIVLTVGAIAVGTVTVIGTIYRVLSLGSFEGTRFVLASNITPSEWFSLAIIAIGGLLAVWGLLVGSAFFVRRSLGLVGSKLNVKRFETAGLLYLIGAATAVIGVGFVIIFVAEIMLAISFFSIEENQSAPPQMQTVSPTAL
jgi:uncharacterized membrane protein